jgi:hypothetical protein
MADRVELMFTARMSAVSWHLTTLFMCVCVSQGLVANRKSRTEQEGLLLSRAHRKDPVKLHWFCCTNILNTVSSSG